MAVTVVIGGQFGSEGKGKVAQYLAGQQHAAAVVRVGGSNSGHTGYDDSGRPVVLRQLPTAALVPGVLCVLGPGSYIDPAILMAEIDLLGVDEGRLIVDERAFLITDSDLESEALGGLVESIGSTGSGTGASVRRRIDRAAGSPSVLDVPRLRPFVRDTTPVLRSILDDDGRVIVEGTQGFGLSVLHSPYYPFVTSRDTSAAGALSEAGLSPIDVDQVVMVLRAFPIRVGGNSGPLSEEVSWESVSEESGSGDQLREYTSVTKRLRRIARFDPEIVRRAIAVNRPTMVIMNHVDYVDSRCVDLGTLTADARAFLADAGAAIGMSIDIAGVGPTRLVHIESQLRSVAS